MVSKSSRVKNCTAIGLCLVMFAFIAARACTMLITYDEAYTYTECALTMNLTPAGILDLYLTANSNNHMLNTLLIALIDRITGAKYVEWLIRLPNLIAAAVYLGVCCIMFLRKHISDVPFTLLVTAYYINEFFSFARGYGLAVCLMTLAFFAYRLWEESGFTETKYPAYILAFYALACTANTICLIIAPVFGLICLMQMAKGRTLGSFCLKYWYVVTLAVLVIVAMLLYHLRVSRMIDGVQYAVLETDFYAAFFTNFGRMVCNHALAGGLIGFFFLATAIADCILCVIRLKKCPTYAAVFLGMALVILALGLVSGEGFYTGRVMVPLFPVLPFLMAECLDGICPVAKESENTGGEDPGREKAGGRVAGRFTAGWLTTAVCILLTVVSLSQLKVDDTREFQSSYETREQAYEADDLYGYDGFYITVFKYYYDEANYLRSVGER